MTLYYAPAPKEVLDLAVQANGKVVICGVTYSFYKGIFQGQVFTSLHGFLLPPTLPSSSPIMRLNANGSVDTSFNSTGNILPSSSSYATLEKVILQPDGKMIVGGFFHTQQSNYNIARLNVNGSIDNSFNASSAIDSLKRVVDLILQQDGKVVVKYIAVGVGGQGGVVRLNSDGSLDNTFNLSGYNLNGNLITNDISFILQQPDGKIFLNPSTRVKSNGVLDTTYYTGPMYFRQGVNYTGNYSAYDAALQQDGKLIIIGAFDSINGYARGGVARLNICNDYTNVSTSVTGVTCPNTLDGSVQFNITGGTPPYSIYGSSNTGYVLDTTIVTPTYSLSNLPSGFGRSYLISDIKGCIYYNTMSVYLGAPYPYNGEQICMVTVEAGTGRNQIIWEKTRGVNTAWFKIYKQNSVTIQYDSIGMVHLDSLSVFTDYNSNPNQQSASYSISVVDSCGNESYQSVTHTTIHLSANQGINNQVNLQWNAYDGFSYPNFEIYRSNNGGAFVLIGSVANSSFSYTDLTPPGGTNYYYVAVTNPNGCNPSRAITKASSNILDGQGNPVLLGIENIKSAGVLVYPNPAQNRFKIDVNSCAATTGYTVKIINTLGQAVFNQAITQPLFDIDVTTWATGTYVLQVLDAQQNIKATKRVVLQ
jgi:uncharacterized delta-60 repeat protein